ncbi:MAG: alpha-glucosidase C-terminal domain-containing protein [Bacteroidales bacterium]|nr:alpha-glucosidase C-terminal domain-containing protein [Bacteroidales bacterium]
MQRILFLSFILLLASCSKNNATTASNSGNKNPNQSDTIQYGTPFNGVPDPRDAVIYQVNMRCFSAAGNFQGVIDRLDSIKALGANVVYLMPIYPVGQVKSINSPYCIKNDREVGSEFGTLSDLRNLVSDAHNLGMAVILDWITDGTSWDCSWIQNHPSWYVRDNSGTIQSPNGYTDIAELNYQSQEMKDTIISNMKYWVKNANIDGFRCDFADFAPSDFWKQALDTLRKLSPAHRYILLAEGTRPANYASGFDYNFGFNFYGTLKSIYANDKSVQLIDNLNISEYQGAVSDTNQIVRYLTNHDVNSSDGTPLDLFGGKSGSMAAFVVVAYMKGVPFIYNGQEVATPFRLTFPFTSTKIDWSINPDVTAEYKKVIGFRDKNETVRRGKLTSYDTFDVCAFTKTLNADTVFVIDNLRNNTVNFTVPGALSNSSWNDVFSGSTVSLGNQVTLQPYSYMVLENKH